MITLMSIIETNKTTDKTETMPIEGHILSAVMDIVSAHAHGIHKPHMEIIDEYAKANSVTFTPENLKQIETDTAELFGLYGLKI